MIKTYLRTGGEATRVMLKKGQSKVSVESQETVTSSLNLTKSSRYFILVWADSIENLKTQLSNVANGKKQLKINADLAIKAEEEALEVKKEEIKAKLTADLKAVASNEAILKGQLDWAIDAIDNRKKALDAEIKALEAEKAKITGAKDNNNEDAVKLMALLEEYKTLHPEGKQVAPAYKKNVEWIKAKIEEFKALEAEKTEE